MISWYICEWLVADSFMSWFNQGLVSQMGGDLHSLLIFVACMFSCYLIDKIFFNHFKF